MYFYIFVSLTLSLINYLEQVYFEYLFAFQKIINFMIDIKDDDVLRYANSYFLLYI